MRHISSLIALLAAALLASCLGGPQVGDSNNGGSGGSGGTPSNRRIVLAPKNGEGGLRLIDSATPGSSVLVDADNIAPISFAVRRTRDSTGAFNDERSEFVVYEKQGKILKVDLATSANATSATQVSSEVEACGPGTLYQNDPDAGLAMYVYTSQGTDDACGTNDDLRRAVRLSMTGADAPLALPAAETVVAELADGTGALVGWLMFDGTTLSRYDVGFTNRRTVAGGAVVNTPDPPRSRDANGVLFVIGSDLRYYDQTANSLSTTLYTRPSGAQFGVFLHDATRTYFTETEASETRIRVLPTSGGTVALLQQQSGNTASSLALTKNRVIYQQPDGTVRSVAKDGTDALNLRSPSAGALLNFAVINDTVVVTETTTQPTLFIHAEANATPIGSSRTNTILSGFTKTSAGNLFGTHLSKIIAVRRLTNAATDASGAVVSIDPASAVEISLGSLSTGDLRFVTEPLQAGDFTSAYSLSAAGGALQRLFTLSAGSASSLRTVQ
jgi:hypothetical protein